MRWLSRGRVVLFLQIGLLVMAGRLLMAATSGDNEIEIIETKYRLGSSNTGEVTFHQRWRALTAKGRTAISKIQIPYIPAFEDVEFKSIRTFKKNGTVVNGDVSGAFDTAPFEDAVARQFTDSKLKTILPPNLDTGDAVEFEAVKRIRAWPKPGDFWFTHYLTTDVSVRSEIVVLDLPAEGRFALEESVTVQAKTEIAAGRRIERWVAENLDAAKPKPGGEHAVFAVSSIPSWDALGKWIYSLNQGGVEPTAEIAALAANLTAEKSSEQERIAALYSYVATKVRYISISFGLGRIQPHRPTEVLHNGYGDCKDQTALLSALLTAAGFKVHAVLTTPFVGVSLRQTPVPDQFNHEFAAVETQSGLVFLDPSIGPAPPQVLAPGVRGLSALVVGELESPIVDIPIQSPAPTRIAVDIKGKVTAAGVFEGSNQFEVRGIVEANLRRIFLDAAEAEKEKALKDLAGAEFRNASVRQIRSGDPADLTKPFSVQFELNDKNFFPPNQSSIRMTLGWGGSPGQLLSTVQKPDKPLPAEALSVLLNMDLIVDRSFTIVDGVAVHRKTAFGGFDSEFSYRSGHLFLKRSLELNGAPITPSDWDAFVELISSAAAEGMRGFDLERRTVPSSAGVLSPLALALREGAAAAQRRDYESAKRAYLEATQLDPKSRVAWNDLGRVYAALHEYDKAETAYKRQIEINPKDLYSYNNLGIVYRALRREDDAILYFQKQIEVSPRDRYAHDNISISYAAKGQWEQARAEAGIAADVTPEDAAKWARLGRAQVKTARIEEARASFDRALALVHDAMTENNIAYYMADAGFDLEKASRLVSGTLEPEARLICEPEALSKDDRCAAQLIRLAFMLDTAGWVLYRQGRLAEAEPYLSSACAIAPHAENQIHLSILLARLGRVDESLRYFADARSRPDFARVDSSEAKKDLAKAVGGEMQLESHLSALQTPSAAPGPVVRVIALVGGDGKVMDVKPADQQAAASLLSESLQLPAISWPGHSIRSIRTIEFRQDGVRWLHKQSYVGQASQAPAPR